MPSGELLAIPKVADLLDALTAAEGEGVGRAEAPRGEVIHYVRLEKGRETMSTWKVRAPTYVNLMAVPKILIGGQIADASIAYASLDPCLSCTNRTVVTDRKTKKKSVLGYEDLHRLSVEKTRRLQV